MRSIRKHALYGLVLVVVTGIIAIPAGVDLLTKDNPMVAEASLVVATPTIVAIIFLLTTAFYPKEEESQ